MYMYTVTTHTLLLVRHTISITCTYTYMYRVTIHTLLLVRHTISITCIYSNYRYLLVLNIHIHTH